MDKLRIYSERRLISGRKVEHFEKEVSDWNADFWIRLYRENEPKVPFFFKLETP